MELVGEHHYPGVQTVSEIFMVNHHTAMVGGGELSMLQLMDGLQYTGHKVSLLTSGEGELAERARAKGHGVHIVPMPPIGWKSMAAISAWKRFLRENSCSILHAQTPRAAFYAGVAGRRAAVPSIFHCRVAVRDRKLDPILVRLASRVICNSRATAARFAAWPWLKPVVIHNGLDVEVVSAVEDRQEPAAMRLLFVGRLSEEKQPEVAWRVFLQLAESFPQLHLTFVGGKDRLNPDLANVLKHQVAQSAYRDRVTWAGGQACVSPWYAMTDIVVMPSKYEGFGRVLVEAMAHGVPVVAFRVGGIPEVVEDGRQGVLVEPQDIGAMGDAVAALLKDDARRRQMGAAGRDRAKHFSLQSHVQAVDAVYRNLTGAGREQ